MINQTKNQPSTNKFYGNYRAIVVDNEPKDEDGNPVYTGKVKVRVIGVHDDVDEEALPWAEYSDPFMGGFEDIGGFLVPNVDSKVWVFFEGGNHDNPVYFAGAPAKPHMPVEREVEDYPQNKVFKTKAGFVIEIDDSEENTRLRVYQPSGNEKISDHTGNVGEVIKGNIDRAIDKKITEAADQRELITAKETNIHTENGNQIILNNDGTIDITVAEKFSVTNNTGELVSWISSLMGILATCTTKTVYGETPITQASDISDLKDELDSMKK